MSCCENSPPRRLTGKKTHIEIIKSILRGLSFFDQKIWQLRLFEAPWFTLPETKSQFENRPWKESFSSPIHFSGAKLAVGFREDQFFTTALQSKRRSVRLYFLWRIFFWLKLKMAKVVESNKIYILILSLKVTWPAGKSIMNDHEWRCISY